MRGRIGLSREPEWTSREVRAMVLMSRPQQTCRSGVKLSTLCSTRSWQSMRGGLPPLPIRAFLETFGCDHFRTRGDLPKEPHEFCEDRGGCDWLAPSHGSGFNARGCFDPEWRADGKRPASLLG